MRDGYPASKSIEDNSSHHYCFISILTWVEFDEWAPWRIGPVLLIQLETTIHYVESGRLLVILFGNNRVHLGSSFSLQEEVKF